MNNNPLAGLWADAADEPLSASEVAPEITVEDIDSVLTRIRARMLREPEMAKAMFESLTVLQAAESAEKVPIEPKMVINWPEGLSERLKKGVPMGALMNTANIGSIPIASDYIDKIRSMTIGVSPGSVMGAGGHTPIVMAKRRTEAHSPRFVMDIEAEFNAADALLDKLMRRPVEQGKSRVIRQMAGGLGIETIEVNSIAFDEADYPHPTEWVQISKGKPAITNADKAKHKAKSRGHKHPGKGW